ncbi:DNA-binding LacI/PurR family transcriptional regulator [Nonomuraea polychroma]|uniref:DNA-binding LacI/PurR family transcriptional regulator n=1 Tax=Nonomuraea polychroma TaxID=46176 RepID=A0A438MC65_9ACTN|nr:LacI family DNA-binding transcriptional regulator [Nonomuraea polychroma]RVX43306.1 DNA-binding LacI/PurR family transcriptional regulator [Nonomuraea polychroma]
MVTRADVARLAGVSTGTVSHVLTGARSIRPETRRKVLDAMEQLGYTPNAMASALAGGRSRIIAIVFPSQPRTIVGSDLEYVLAATDAARARGFHVVLWTSGPDDLHELRQLAKAGLVQGFLLMQVTLTDERVKFLESAGIPVALIGRTQTPGHVPYADADFTQIARMVAEHLAGLGHRTIGMLNAPYERGTHGIGAAVRFADDVRRTCADLGLGCTIVASAHTVRAGRAALRELLDAAPETTAIISYNWEATLGAMHEARALGRPIPERLSLVLCSNGEPESTDPELTTATPPATEIATAAVEALIDHLADPDTPPAQRLVPSVLVERNSTAPPYGS